MGAVGDFAFRKQKCLDERCNAEEERVVAFNEQQAGRRGSESSLPW